AAAVLRRHRRAHQRGLARVRGRAQEGRRTLRGDGFPRRAARLQQRHDAALRRGRREAGLVAHDRALRPDPAMNGAAMAFMISSTASAPQAQIPALYTGEGKAHSPPLEWHDAPAGTRSFVLIVDDPDAPDPAAPQRTWVHWVLFNLPADAKALPEA